MNPSKKNINKMKGIFDIFISMEYQKKYYGAGRNNLLFAVLTFLRLSPVN